MEPNHEDVNHVNGQSSDYEGDSDEMEGDVMNTSDDDRHSSPSPSPSPPKSPSYTQYKDKPISFVSVLLVVLTAPCVGFLFGFIVEKSRVFEPIHMQGQMLCAKLVLVKFMMAAVSSGMFFLSLTAMLPFTHNYYTQACIRFYGQLSDKGLMACLVGGAIMGVGMALCGSSPDLVWVQLGAGVDYTGDVLRGAVIGTVVYGVVKRWLYPVTEPFLRSSTNPWLDASYFVTALPLVAMFAMLVLAFEILVPWETEYKKHQLKYITDDSYLESYIWSPLLSGVLVGALQLPMVLGVRHTVGADAALAIPVSQVFVGPVKRLSRFFNQRRQDYRSYWQILYVSGVVLGAYYSSVLSHNTLHIKHVWSPHHALVGGTIMAFGCFMCGGSISIHGVSGMSMLSILSFISMFGAYIGGMCTSLMLKHHDMLVQGVITAAKQNKD